MFLMGEYFGNIKQRWKNLNNQFLLCEEDQAQIRNLLRRLDRKANTIQVPTRDQLCSFLSDMVDVSIIIHEMNEKYENEN